MIKKLITDIRTAIGDRNRPIHERVFLIYSIISEIAVLIAFCADIQMGEHPGELILLGIVILFVPFVTIVCMYKNRIRFAVGLIVVGLLAFILPVLFFLGGGLEGGGVLWIIFAFMYIGLVISGKWRKILLVILFLESLAMYLIGFYYPGLIQTHSHEMFYKDSFVSLILVGIVCFVMTWFQNRLFRDETRRAKEAAEKAEELNRSQNRFFSSMSHEIRTPINSILGLNELILRDQSASEEVLKDASGIQGAGKLLLSLINDILDFSKMEAGSMDIVPVDYKIGDMLSEIVNMIWLKAHDKGLAFHVSVDPKVPSVLYGDEVRIKQVIINLLNNAVKYTAEGSVELHVENEILDEDSVVLNISISDTGMGIKKEALPFLFDAFKRVDEEKNRHIEGTGLGLSIVKQLMDLMGGTITVNSVYGEGSTFVVTLRQGISDATQIGDLNIHNQQFSGRGAYESSFKAPEAGILIVDDNEMNLEVEKKLLAETGMRIDTAVSGQEALDMCLRTGYDVILMDHLMPQMDGIECLEKIRVQTGGLNRNTPVLVLTANAGSENRDLYNRSGFDGYLVKPVSGVALEESLMKHIPAHKIVLNNKMMQMREDINTAAGYARKAPVIITSTSVCDLPDAVVKKLRIPILPFLIRTEEGSFKDGIQMDADELIRYIENGGEAVSYAPDVKAYTEFFANALKRAHHLIHISLTSTMSQDYDMACEAAKAFDNVTVINSGCLSSATGILVLIAQKLVQQNVPVEEIVEELQKVKKHLRCSFVIDTTDYMAKKGHIRQGVHRVAKALNLHPSLKVQNNKSWIGGISMGSTKRAYRNYIHKAFPGNVLPDPDVVFITYADVPIKTLYWIKDEIGRIAGFEHVVFKQASAAISSNCGPGTFGILYAEKTGKNYNIGSYIGEEKSREEETALLKTEDLSRKTQTLSVTTETVSSVAEPGEESIYREIPGIDFEQAIKNSGSEDAFKTVLKLFYESIPAKTQELEDFYQQGDWQDYTIKIHALKSSAKLIGAMDLSEKAQDLETAGKEERIGFIRENHGLFMSAYEELKDHLAAVYKTEKEPEETSKESQKPLADEFLMSSVYEGFKEAAETMDCEALEMIMKELEEYAIPEKDRDTYEKLCEKAKIFDYAGMLEILK